MDKVGYLCTFTPRELIFAAGFLPVRILAGNQPVSLANPHLQSYSCSQARGSLERLLTGELDLYAVVFTRSCDTLMRLADIWERNSNMRVYSLEFPTKIRETTLGFLKEELYDFKSVLENWSGRVIEDRELISSIKLYAKLEKVLSEVFQLHPDYELALKAQTEDPRDILEKAEERLESLKIEKAGMKDSKKAVVTGSVCPLPEVLRIIGESGFSVIDDLCTGTRFFTFEIEDGETSMKNLSTTDDAIEFLARKYFKKAPCPTKNYPQDRRIEYVLEKAKNADTVIFLLLKFCEPHFFDYPQLKERLESMGKKTLLLELEFPVSVEQLKTRLEAFYETL